MDIRITRAIEIDGSPQESDTEIINNALAVERLKEQLDDVERQKASILNQIDKLTTKITDIKSGKGLAEPKEEPVNYDLGQ